MIARASCSDLTTLVWPSAVRTVKVTELPSLFLLQLQMGTIPFLCVVVATRSIIKAATAATTTSVLIEMLIARVG